MSRATVFGGPIEAVEPSGTTIQREAALESFPSTSDAPSTESPDDSSAVLSVAPLALLGTQDAALGGGFSLRGGLVVYQVVKGDSLSKIAKNFGISLDTILNANPDLRGKAIRVGQEISILPVSGVMHLVSEKDTLKSIAALYRVTPEDIVQANKEKIVANVLPVGEELIIPGAKVQGALYAVDTSLPNLPGYFTLPTTGWNWGQLHPDNAVDIANACGTPIFSAAEGLVTRIGDPSQWSGGYGGFVEIEHPNGTHTLYAHAEKLEVVVGDYVSQKQEIALIGNTGNTHGPSGCHLHFEVHGARNPFAK